MKLKENNFYDPEIAYDPSDYVKCLFCEKTFISSAKHRKYCSNQCYKNGIKKRQNEKQHERYVKSLICRHCKKQCKYDQRYVAQCCLDEECIQKEKIRRRRISLKKYYNKHFKKPNKKKNRQNAKQYRKRHKNKINLKDRFRSKIKRNWIIKYKQKLKCEKCGEDRFYCLDFHHKNTENKNESIYHLISQKYGTNKILNEIRKYIVLCKNCHAESHFLQNNDQMQEGIDR